MNLANLKIKTFIMLSCSILAFPSICFAQDDAAPQDIPAWKDSNNKAIQAMREQRFDDSEKLFRQALSQCSSPDGKATINENLGVLLKKEGKIQEARVEQNDSATMSPLSNMRLDGQQTNPEQTSQIKQTIAQIDAEIRKADDKGDLEMLQELFQKKGQAVKVRDGSETLDYAYCLHFRAQILEQLHRNDEANALETQASRLRDQLRRLAASAPAAPAKTRSTLGQLNFQPIDPPTSRTVQPYQQNYASATPINRRAPHSFRNFSSSNSGDTSGFLNGNPNAPSSW